MGDFERTEQIETTQQDSEAATKAKQYFSLEHIRSAVRDTMLGATGDNKRSFSLERLAGAEDLFPGKKEQYQELLDKLRSGTYASDEDFLEKLSVAIHSFATSNYSFEQLGQNMARREQDEAFEDLNDILSYGGTSRLIHIHVLPKPEVLEGKRLREKVEYVKSQIKAGLQKLAGLMETDPRWKKVQKVTAISWLVAKHPEVLEELKFTIEGEIDPELRASHFQNDTRKISVASITREAFLQEYGNKESWAAILK